MELKQEKINNITECLNAGGNYKILLDTGGYGIREYVVYKRNNRYLCKVKKKKDGLNNFEVNEEEFKQLLENCLILEGGEV